MQQNFLFTPGGSNDPLNVTLPNGADIHSIWLPAPTNNVLIKVPLANGSWQTIYQVSGLTAESIPIDNSGYTTLQIASDGNGGVPFWIIISDQYVSPYKGATSVSSQTGILNIRDFGAVGNFEANDYESIQNTIYQAALFGGEVFIPPGDFVNASVAFEIPNNVIIRGLNNQTSFIRAGAGINGGTSDQIFTNSLSTEPMTQGQIIQTGIKLLNFGIDGNAPNNTSAHNSAIFLKGVYGAEVSNMNIINCDNDGILIVIDTGGDFWNPATDAATILDNNYVDLCTIVQGGKGFPIRGIGVGGIRATRNRVGFRNILITNDAMDFPGCSNCIIGWNQVTMCGDGFGTNGTGDVLIIGNIAYMVGAYGIAAFASGGMGPGGNGVNRLVMTGNDIYLPGKLGYRVAGQSTPTYPIVISDSVVTYNDNGSGVGAITLEVDHGILHDVEIDLTDSPAVAINYKANYWKVHDVDVVNGGATGAIGINLHLPANGFKAYNNDFSGVNIPLAFVGTVPGGDYIKALMNTDAVVRNNDGINPLSLPYTQPTIPAASTPWQNTTGFDLTIYISGGSVTSVRTGASGTFSNLLNTGQNTGGFRVPIGGWIAWTGSGASWVVVPE